MRFSVLQENFHTALAAVSKFVDPKAHVPVAANILLTAGDAVVRLTGMDLSNGVTMTATIGAKIDLEGAITLPTKTLTAFVGNLSPERIDLKLNQATFTMALKCGASKGSIKGIDANEYPAVPEVESQFNIPGGDLKSALRDVLMAAATDDNRPILTGVLFSFDAKTGKLTLATADGYRLAVHELDIDMTGVPFPEGQDRLEIVVPAKMLKHVASLLTKSEVGVFIDMNRIGFKFEKYEVVIMLLEGRFPDIMAVIPRTSTTSVSAYAEDLRRALSRAEIFAKDSANCVRVIINKPKGPGEPGEIMVFGLSAERGESDTVIDAGVDGENVEISFNGDYFADAMDAMDERTVLTFNGSANPCVIRRENDDSYTYVIMPMSVIR